MKRRFACLILGLSVASGLISAQTDKKSAESKSDKSKTDERKKSDSGSADSGKSAPDAVAQSSGDPKPDPKPKQVPPPNRVLPASAP